ncbi:protein trachealess-like isoform X5 [Dinothrombium tinctorium]|uniref:Protein trachealess-like isoform X5 n=1 Tax=Dinothrombium tinctorium TaxID=1965070 RepID=A0A3S3Q6U1_9ACAR|nr:protein trachealess-like isoform X5 [Dinothrombium tinctorium]
MRKEKSRDAARSRRGKENHEFYELAKLLPLPAAITSQLDKASIIRLTISYLKLREFALNGDPSWDNCSSSSLNNNALKNSKLCNIFDVHQGTHILQSLDGFAFALGHDGRFLYISETVSIYLGLSQVEMTGSSVFDYCHQQDHAELAEHLGMSHNPSTGSQLSSSPLPPASVGSNASSESDSTTPFSNPTNVVTANGVNDTFERQFCIRMKSTLTKRGCQHYKTSGYRVVHIVSHLRPEAQIRRNSGNTPPKIVGMVAVAIALPPPSVNELRLESDMFVMRLGLDFIIAHCEPKISDLLDYTADEVTGRSLYSMIHGQDVIHLRKCHLDLIHKGQVMSKYYRIINKNGGYTWVQTCATLICSNNNGSNKNSTNSANNNEEQEQSIITINYVISGIEYEDVIMDASQLPGGLTSSCSTPPLPSKGSSPKATSPSPSPPPQQQFQSQSQQRQHRQANPRPSSIQMTNGSPISPLGQNNNEVAKRRRFTSSPVRPWKSPSPPSTNAMVEGDGNGSSQANTPASNLLRHISVIRETPPILKPQVVAPPYHPHAHHPAHYHHLVDPYAAAYHLYKNGGGPGTGMTTASTPPSSTAAPHHHWGAYN